MAFYRGYLTLVKRFWRSQWCRATAWQTLLSFSSKIQTVNPVNTLMVPSVTLPAYHLEPGNLKKCLELKQVCLHRGQVKPKAQFI
ncbi:Uncharacterised protein [Leclercia adecarboxylata]|uniref:Uncharacterized protein n=1 Tax=Leclercia adecarboxylata TaxID=83655 RepID=A0A4U9IEQ1_9ENTR|nr:hypothetical protein WP5S18E01_32210 [Enterobacter cloacae]SPX65478.1 Uncharacterised protein [Leclercia adecarboxylata]STX23732.1 Uncharacterised protein [Leclercia adecarboxylata]VTP75155.1 Uncharacterised protein [Leclercia adecarboxylata]